MHLDTATRQHWMSVLSYSKPESLAAKMVALNIRADYETLRARKPVWSSYRAAWAAPASASLPVTLR